MLAVENEKVIAHTRFYPPIISELTGEENMCCQQPEYAPTNDMIKMDLPALSELTDRSLRIYCWHIHKDYRNRGLSHAILDAIIEWAKEHKWQTIFASAGVNDPWVASLSCAPMLRTFLKYGFEITDTVKSPELLDYLKKFRDGEFGAEGKEKFKKSLAGKNLAQAAIYYKVKINL
jgi:ribosomal protein S18 acetylase RimI-like enzyme